MIPPFIKMILDIIIFSYFKKIFKKIKNFEKINDNNKKCAKMLSIDRKDCILLRKCAIVLNE